MTSRKRIEAPTSQSTAEDRYYMKQVSIHRAYSTIEDAQKLASKMRAVWSEQFRTFYVSLHSAEPFKGGTDRAFPPALKGVAIRLGNYVLENYLLTGRVSYAGALAHLTVTIPDEFTAKYLILLTVATAVKNPKIVAYLTSYQKAYYDAISPYLQKVTGFPEDDEPVVAQFDAVAQSTPLMPVTRSVAYYYTTGEYEPPSGTTGTQGGEVHTPPPVPRVVVTPSSQVSILDQIVNKMAKYK